LKKLFPFASFFALLLSNYYSKKKR
jgi:hypothetical protein